MEHLIKHDPNFWREFIHLKSFFLYSLFNPSSTHFDSVKFNPDMPDIEKPADCFSVGFFLLFTNNINNA